MSTNARKKSTEEEHPGGGATPALKASEIALAAPTAGQPAVLREPSERLIARAAPTVAGWRPRALTGERALIAA